MKKEINLPEVVDKLRNTEYNPKVRFLVIELTVQRFDAMIMRIREPKCTALVFKSGKVVLAGTKSTKETEAAGRRVVDILSVSFCFTCDAQRFTGGNKSDDTKPIIHNMVAVGDFKFPIRLEGLSIEYLESTTVQPAVQINSQYEPELFSGLIYRMKNPDVVLLIFVSGKVVVTGAKDESDIRQAFRKISPLIYNCRKV